MQCPRCEIGDYGRSRREDVLRHVATVDAPEMEELEAMVMDSEDVYATDGCIVEPDGSCPHGHTSWMRVMGII